MKTEGPGLPGKSHGHDPGDSLIELAKFAGHTLLGVLIYLIILGAALAVGAITHWVEARGFIHDEFVLLGLKFAEKALVLTDLVLLGYWLVYSTYKHIRATIRAR